MSGEQVLRVMLVKQLGTFGYSGASGEMVGGSAAARRGAVS
jgi:hypothetical protein